MRKKLKKVGLKQFTESSKFEKIRIMPTYIIIINRYNIKIKMYKMLIMLYIYSHIDAEAVLATIF